MVQKQTRYVFLVLLLVGQSFSLSLCAQEIKKEHFKGQEFSLKEGVLSKIATFQDQPQPSENNQQSPIYADPIAEQQYGIQLYTDSERERAATEVNYGFHGHIYGGMNIPFASATDANGNLYITGGSANTQNPEGNFVTIKIDSTGNTVWEARKPGTLYAVEYGMEITVDSLGNPIASGVHWNGNDMDLRTIKYDAQTGAVIWQKTYDGGNQGLDAPAAITTDQNGNVYVAGITYTGTSVAYLTLKYDTSGTLLWSVADTNSLVDSWNEPAAIAVDTSGNVVVTGYGGNANYYAGYYTKKYSSTGTELWEQLYNYQPGGTETNSFAKDIAFDANGNYYVTGVFGDDEIIGTIKYDGLGVQQWIETYQTGTDHTRAFGVEVVSDTIYVGGAHFGGYVDDGLVLISYKDDGTQNWTAETNNLIEIRVGHLTLDSNHLPVIAGLGDDANTSDHQIRVYKYNTDGTLLKDADYIKPSSNTEGFTNDGFIGMELGSNDSVYITLSLFATAEGGIFEYSNLSLNSATTNPVWTETYSNDGTTRSNMLNSISDGNNNTYVTSSFGAYENGAYITKLSVVKYDDQGDVSWEKIFDPAANGYGSTGISVAINSAGEVVIYLSPSVFEDDPLRLKKYDNQGNLLWDIQKNVFSSSLYVFFTDANDNIYIAGSSQENQTDPFPVFTAMKFSTTGQELWTSYTPSTDTNDNIYALNAGGINSQGELVLTGAFGEGGFFSEEVDMAVLKYASNGTLQTLTAMPITDHNTSGTDLTIDGNDNSYVTGVKQNKNTGAEELLVVKLNAQNQEQWTSTFTETGRNIRPYAIDQLSTGELIVSGRSYVVGQNNKVILAKYDTTGNEVWSTASDLQRFYKDIHIDDLDNAHILYQVQTGAFPYRLYYSSAALPLAGLWEVDSQGNSSPEELFFGPELSSFFPSSLVPLQNGILLLGGTLGNEAAFYEGLFFFESTHSVLGIDDPNFIDLESNWLGQNYPNPVRDRTFIPFHLNNPADVQIKLYSITGRFLFTLANDFYNADLNKVEVDISQLDPGIYIYKLFSDNFEEAKKMIVE